VFRTAILIVVFVSSFILITSATVGLELLMSLMERYLSVRIGLGMMGVLASTSYAYIWISMLSHCYNNFSGSRRAKGTWLVALWFANLLAALVYYIMYVELGEDEPIS